MSKRLKPEEEVVIGGLVRLKNPMRHAIRILIGAPEHLVIETLELKDRRP